MGRRVATLEGLQGSTGAGSGVYPPPRRSRATLRTLDDVAAELARLYRRAERGDMHTADASRLAFILVSLGKVIEASSIEARLTALEAVASEKR